MRDYWLDADCLIQSKNGPYAFETFPIVWDTLEDKIDDGVLAICYQVGEELLKGKDALRDWARKLKDKGAFVTPDAPVFNAVTKVSNYAKANYAGHQAADFLAGADPWVIANVMARGGRIVTHEVPDLHKSIQKRKVKIPDVARHFGLEPPLHINELFPALGIKFT